MLNLALTNLICSKLQNDCLEIYVCFMISHSEIVAEETLEIYNESWKCIIHLDVHHNQALVLAAAGSVSSISKVVGSNLVGHRFPVNEHYGTLSLSYTRNKLQFKL